MTSVMVTGGAGFIGSHIVDALIRANARVSVIQLWQTLCSVADSEIMPEYQDGRPGYILHSRLSPLKAPGLPKLAAPRSIGRGA